MVLGRQAQPKPKTYGDTNPETRLQAYLVKHGDRGDLGTCQDDPTTLDNSSKGYECDVNYGNDRAALWHIEISSDGYTASAWVK